MHTRASRATGVAALAFGLFLLALVPAFSLFERTRAAETVTDTFRQTMSAEGLRVLERDYATLRGLGTQFIDEVRPALAERLGMTQAELDALIEERFPAVAAGVEQVPPAVALVDPVIPALKASQDEYESVDAIPIEGLPFTATPWLIVGAGLLFTGLGVLAIVRPSRAAALAAGGAGALTAVVALAVSTPQKFNDVHEIMPVGRVSLSQRAADTAERTIVVVGRMVDEVQGDLLPYLQTQLDVSSGELDALLREEFPAVVKGLEEWPQIERLGANLAARQQATVDDLQDGDGAPFRTLPWLVIAPALLVVAVAGVALATTARRQARA